MALVWIDIDNLPHIPIFQPLIAELQAAGHEILLTVRDFAFSVEKLEDSGQRFEVIGKHYGKATLSKVMGTLWRAWQLRRFLRHYPVDLAVSHSSRSAILAAWSRGIPRVAMFDYEHVSTALQERLATHILVPELLLKSGALKQSQRYHGYPGFKEEIYLAGFLPDPDFRKQLQVPESALLAVLRPPATTAHYHNPEAEAILRTILERLDCDGVFTLIMPRSPAQVSMFTALAKRRGQIPHITIGCMPRRKRNRIPSNRIKGGHNVADRACHIPPSQLHINNFTSVVGSGTLDNRLLSRAPSDSEVKMRFVVKNGHKLTPQHNIFF